MANTSKSTEGRAPFSREEIILETRKAVLAVASLLAYFSPYEKGHLAKDYLGVELDAYDLDGISEEELLSVPIESHRVYRIVMDAFDHAYQVGRALTNNISVQERMHEVDAILNSFPQTDFDGQPSPLDRLNPQKFRQVLETFLARYWLDDGLDLSVRQLALLANMGEAAVRTSLSKEGLTTLSKAKGELGVITHGQALAWLHGRRGFIPTIRHDGEPGTDDGAILLNLLENGKVAFPKALEMVLDVLKLTPETLSKKADVPLPWLQKVFSEDATNVDLEAIIRVANALQVPAPVFAAKAVEHLLSRAQ
jgi:hypothetical protein